MRLAIADPPYLGRADRWYGSGRGSGRTRATEKGRNGRRPDHHPDASEWDDPDRHRQLVRDLARDYDGWAVAGAPDYVDLLLAAAPPGAQLAIWHRPNAMPGGARVLVSWEPVVVFVPPARRGRATGITVRDVLSTPVLPQGFLGSKPPAWTSWVLAMLGHDAEADEVADLFPGSGAVARATGVRVLL